MSRLILILAVLTVTALAPALAEPPQSQPPPFVEPKPAKRNFTLLGSDLTIEPSMKAVYLRIGGGVRITGEGIVLSAAQVEVQIEPTRLISANGIKLPKLPDDRESIVRDPGRVAADMARELELPQPKFTASALRRVAATGGIVATTKDITLRAPQLISTDGGRSWSAEGRSTITRKGSDATYGLAADNLLYDTQDQRASARGNIEASFSQSGDEPVVVRAQRLELDVKRGQLTVSDGLSAQYGDIHVSTGGISADLRGQTGSAQGVQGKPMLSDEQRGIQLSAGELSFGLDKREVQARGGVQLEASKQGLSLSAESISARLGDQMVEASGGVKLADTQHGVSVEAGSVVVDLKDARLTATGSAVVRYGDSTFTGEKIMVQQKDKKTVVEVEGKQTARLNAKQLQELAK